MNKKIRINQHQKYVLLNGNEWKLNKYYYEYNTLFYHCHSKLKKKMNNIQIIWYMILQNIYAKYY